MATLREFTEIEAWKCARVLTNEVYKVSSVGIFSRDFALRDQIRRAAISVQSNIAEGFERGGNREFSNFLSMAIGSAGELESQLFTALDQGYISEDRFEQLRAQARKTRKLCAALMNYLIRSDMKGARFKARENQQPTAPQRKQGTGN